MLWVIVAVAFLVALVARIVSGPNGLFGTILVVGVVGYLVALTYWRWLRE